MGQPMPLMDMLPEEIFRCAGYCVVPLAFNIGAQYLAFTNKSVAWWWQEQKKPKWALQNGYIHLALDTAALLCYGLAGYSVERHKPLQEIGVNVDSAMVLWWSTLGLCSASVIVLGKSKNLKWASLSYLSSFGVALTSVLAFGRISRNAGFLSLPWALAIGHSALMFCHMWRLN